MRQSAATLYRGRDRRWWHARFAAARQGKGPPLRVLGITSRFTTVLQYSMRDALNALRANGCETRLLIEPDPYSLIPPQRKLEAIREFQPDLVLLIDHTRQGQQAGLIGDVPVLTWIQDRLPWLFNRQTGQSLGPLDFCMGFSSQELVQNCGYPADRFLPCEMATDPAAFATQLSSEREAQASALLQEQDDAHFHCDVAYATNAPQAPEAFRETYGRHVGESVGKLLDAVYEELVALTNRAGLNGALQCEPFLARLEKAVGIELTPEARRGVAAEYVRPLVDRLLRRQTISWAAAWAEQTGRRFHLYGNGWHSDPEFAKYARGFVRHGPELGRAFRAARINLHAGCNHALHQRVLDGLAAGGFFLVRRHADDVSHRVSRAIYDLARARGLCPGVSICGSDLPPPLDKEYVALTRMNGLDPLAPVELTQANLDGLKALHESQTVQVAGQLWPEFERITFGTASELADQLEWFLRHDDQRRAIAASMRQRVLEVFGYQSLMKTLLCWLEESLGRE